MHINLIAGWIGLLIGCVAGAVPGLFFHNRTWLGGYSSWSRRMIRLGHISFFGLGFLNIAFALTVLTLERTEVELVSYLFLLGAIAMPLVCYLSAWRIAFRHLFFIPAGSITLGIGLFCWRLIDLS